MACRPSYTSTKREVDIGRIVACSGRINPFCPGCPEREPHPKRKGCTSWKVCPHSSDMPKVRCENPAPKKRVRERWVPVPGVDYNVWVDGRKTRHTKPHRYKNPGESQLMAVYTSYMLSAAKRNYTWNLTVDQFKSIIKQNCHYCGAPPSQESKGSKKKASVPYLYNGVDRLDNSNGYFIDNVVPCCGDCNRTKFTKSKIYFLEFIKRVYEFNFNVAV